MVWYEILIAILGSVGGLAGIGAFLKSVLTVKQDREGKDIQNEGSEIENLRTLIGILNDSYDRLNTQFHEYKQEVDERIAFFKNKFDKMEQEKQVAEAANMQANRCPYPPTLDDCPVFQYLKEHSCPGCDKKHTSEE